MIEIAGLTKRYGSHTVLDNRVGDVVRRSDSPLSTALLPDQTVQQPGPGAVLWQLRYTAAAVDPSWLSRLSRELGTDIALLSGLVETVGGEHAGRLTVRMSADLDPGRVAAAFAGYGIHARVAEAAGELAGVA